MLMAGFDCAICERMNEKLGWLACRAPSLLVSCCGRLSLTGRATMLHSQPVQCSVSEQEMLKFAQAE